MQKLKKWLPKCNHHSHNHSKQISVLQQPEAQLCARAEDKEQKQRSSSYSSCPQGAFALAKKAKHHYIEHWTIIIQESNRRQKLVNTYWTHESPCQIPGVPYLYLLTEHRRDRVEIKSVEFTSHTQQSVPHHASEDEEEDGEGPTCHVSHQHINIVTKQEFLPIPVITLKCWCSYGLVLGPFSLCLHVICL